MGGITVNGQPLEKHVAEELGREIELVRQADQSVRLPPVGASKITRHLSGERSSKGKDYIGDSATTHVIINGELFGRLSKAPYTRSGESGLGILEFNADTGDVKCHECGEWFKKLATHIRQRRDSHPPVSAYRSRHGFHVRGGLCSPAVSSQAKSLRQRRKTVRTRTFSPQERAMGLAKRSFMQSLRPSGMKVSPEIANMRAKCIAQREAELIAMYKSLGRAPTAAELTIHVNGDNVRSLIPASLSRIFGAPLSGIFARLGIPPRGKGQKTIEATNSMSVRAKARWNALDTGERAEIVRRLDSVRPIQ